MEDELHPEPKHEMRVTHLDGVRTTVCENRFEIVARPGCYIGEVEAVKALRQWIRKRHQDLREPGDLPE